MANQLSLASESSNHLVFVFCLEFNALGGLIAVLYQAHHLEANFVLPEVEQLLSLHFKLAESVIITFYRFWHVFLITHGTCNNSQYIIFPYYWCLTWLVRSLESFLFAISSQALGCYKCRYIHKYIKHYGSVKSGSLPMAPSPCMFPRGKHCNTSICIPLFFKNVLYFLLCCC